MLADGLGRCREVEDHLRAAECHVRRGRHCRPEVFAQLHAELRAVDLEREACAEIRSLPRDGDRLFGDACARCEPAVLVEFRIVGDIGFGDDAKYAPLREDHGAVVERLSVAQRGPRDHRQRQLARVAYQPC